MWDEEVFEDEEEEEFEDPTEKIIRKLRNNEIDDDAGFWLGFTRAA